MLTQDSNATATFNFTGIAIYFLSPLWPYNVSTAVSLDSAPATLLDLVDHSRPNIGTGPETVQSHVVWNATGLTNIQHTLRISVGAGQSFAIVDGLIYTDTSSPTTTTDRVIASSTAGQTTETSSSSKPALPIALGTVLGLLGLLLIFLAFWFFFRKRRRPMSEAWTVSGSSVAGRAPPPPPGTAAAYWNATTGNQGYAMRQAGDGTWQNTRYGHVGMAPPPMPPQPMYGYNAYPYGAPQMSGAPSAYHPPQGHAPNRYLPGDTLSTITERSTPQMSEGRTPLVNSPASLQSELGYYTAPASEAAGSTMSNDARGGYGVQIESKHKIPDYSRPLNQAGTLGRSAQSSGWI
ncbi:unnamed protein product [Cyclocybe aegerita]|uniref:Transmembrane protein n=1 Tax=Cyclocybe aegerita TaxID=1973307 RepID=A0A8S0W496_CYCAE|nr:unnamed protein product [Cyclocybe aegerita]